MDGLRQFVMVDNHEAVKVCELDKKVKSSKVVKPKLRPNPEGVVWEGVEELTL